MVTCDGKKTSCDGKEAVWDDSDDETACNADWLPVGIAV